MLQFPLPPGQIPSIEAQHVLPPLSPCDFNLHPNSDKSGLARIFEASSGSFPAVYLRLSGSLRGWLSSSTKPSTHSFPPPPHHDHHQLEWKFARLGRRPWHQSISGLQLRSRERVPTLCTLLPRSHTTSATRSTNIKFSHQYERLNSSHCYLKTTF